MMWTEKHCGICSRPMKMVYTSDDDPIQLWRCPEKIVVPEETRKLLVSQYAQETLNSHFEVEYQSGVPVHQIVTVYPFNISIYDNRTTISKWDEAACIKKVFQTNSILSLPWNDSESLISKIKLYATFS